MVVSSRCFEQYCIHKKKNVRIVESLLQTGERQFICHESGDCRECKNYIVPYRVKILNLY